MAGVAQSVEQRTRNAKVVGSIPISGTSQEIRAVPSSRIRSLRSPPSAGFLLHAVPSSFIPALVL